MTVSVQQLVADVQAGKGLAGTLLQNPQVSTNVQLLAANLSLVSSNLNRFGLWHILWSHRPPATTKNPRSNPTQPPMKQLWPIRILFLGLCIMGGYAISQAPEYVSQRTTAFSA